MNSTPDRGKELRTYTLSTTTQAGPCSPRPFLATTHVARATEDTTRDASTESVATGSAFSLKPSDGHG